MRKMSSSGNISARNAVELLRGGQVAPKWLFNNHARVFIQFRGAQSVNHSLKKRGRNC